MFYLILIIIFKNSLKFNLNSIFQIFLIYSNYFSNKFNPSLNNFTGYIINLIYF